MKVLGGILIVTGLFIIMGMAGQGDYEAFALAHGKVVEVAPFKTQILTALAGIGGIGFGLAILKGE